MKEYNLTCVRTNIFIWYTRVVSQNTNEIFIGVQRHISLEHIITSYLIETTNRMESFSLDTEYGFIISIYHTICF